MKLRAYFCKIISDKFGRYLGTFYESMTEATSINQDMIDKGLAREYHGGKR